jgi:phospholipase C
MGPRVPLYVISPWTKGGWVNSQVSDHTSVIRFIEARFGVHEPLISAWRRAVSSDLTNCFDFAKPEDSSFVQNLPDTTALRARALALPGTKTPATPSSLVAPQQDAGIRPARPLPYDLQAHARMAANSVSVTFDNQGEAGAVFHVYNRLALEELPRRYTVEAGKQLEGQWPLGTGSAYDLWILGPNGWHRHLTGTLPRASTTVLPEVQASSDRVNGELVLTLRNTGSAACTFTLQANKYDSSPATEYRVSAGNSTTVRLPLGAQHHWYDHSVRVKEVSGYSRRFAGHLETGSPSISDPAMQGSAQLDQYRV